MTRGFLKSFIRPRKNAHLSSKLATLETTKIRTKKAVIPSQRIVRPYAYRTPVRLPPIRRKVSGIPVPYVLLKTGSKIEPRIQDVRNFVASQVTPWGGATQLDRHFSTASSVDMYQEGRVDNCTVYMMGSNQNVARRWPQDNYRTMKNNYYTDSSDQLPTTSVRHCNCHNCLPSYYRVSSGRCKKCFSNQERWYKIQNERAQYDCSSSSDSLIIKSCKHKKCKACGRENVKAHLASKDVGTSYSLESFGENQHRHPLYGFKDDVLRKPEQQNGTKPVVKEGTKTTNSYSSGHEESKVKKNTRTSKGDRNNIRNSKKEGSPSIANKVYHSSSSGSGYSVTRKKSVQEFKYTTSPSSVARSYKRNSRRRSPSPVNRRRSPSPKLSSFMRKSEQTKRVSIPNPRFLSASKRRQKSQPNSRYRPRKVQSRWASLQSAVRPRLIADSKRRPAYENANIKEFVNFLSSLSMNTIGTLTNKRKALRLFRNYLHTQRSP